MATHVMVAFLFFPCDCLFSARVGVPETGEKVIPSVPKHPSLAGAFACMCAFILSGLYLCFKRLLQGTAMTHMCVFADWLKENSTSTNGYLIYMYDPRHHIWGMYPWGSHTLPDRGLLGAG